MVVVQAGVVVLAAITAGVMGFAIQRGATCMVAAVDEAILARRFGRALALAEAAVWVSGLLALGALLGFSAPDIQAYPAGWPVIAGGALLGFGAVINGACVFGAVARLGSGEIHYLLTPLGFFGGALLHHWFAMPAAPLVGHAEGPGLTILLLFLPFAAWRMGASLQALKGRRARPHFSHPHRATIIIGVAFVALLVLAGPWTYSQILVRAAEHGMGFRAIDLGLLAALLAGAVIGGRTMRVPLTWTARGAAGCVAGGALMGAGGAMIPGGNDNLILVGLPMAMPYAWQAITAMTLAICAGLIVKARWRRIATTAPTIGVPLQ